MVLESLFHITTSLKTKNDTLLTEMKFLIKHFKLYVT